MKFFVDSADLGQIQRWVGCGVASGVTTNPTILAKHGGLCKTLAQTAETPSQRDYGMEFA